MEYINQSSNIITLRVRLSPNARRNGIEGLWNNQAVKIALNAPAIDGKANAALIDFLSRFAGLRKSAVIIESGEINRLKRLRLTFKTADEADLFIQSLTRLL